MAFRCLFHVHTRFSFDSLQSPASLVNAARKQMLDVLIVTDHNTIEGALAVRRLAEREDLMVPIAAEYQSEKGDIIGVFLKEEIRSRESGEILRQIHEQGGLAILPHPYKGHRLDEDLLSQMDLIETHNARCGATDNAQALELAQAEKRPGVAGADAHCFLELDAARMDFEAPRPRNEIELRTALLEASRRFVTRSAPRLCRPYSQMVKAAKARDVRSFLYQAKRMGALLAGGAER